MNVAEAEMALISSIEDSSDLGHIAKVDITKTDFDKCREVWDWYLSYIRQYGKLPPLGLITATFDYFQPHKIEGAVQNLSEEVKKNSVLRQAKALLLEEIAKIEGDTYGTIDAISSKLGALRPRNNLSISVTDKDSQKRVERYTTLKDTIGVTTIPTGFSFFDDRKAYYQPGEFTGFVARTFVGKSWALIYSCAVGWARGKRVLFITPELGIEETERRFDVVLANQLAKPVLLSDLRYGHLGSQDNYRSYAEEASKRSELVTVDSIGGRKASPQRILQLIDQFKPDIIGIDGIKYLDDDQRGGAGWEKIFNVSTDLKQMAVLRHVVILTVQQVKREVPPTRVPLMEDVAFGDGFVQALDRCITLSFNEEDPKFRDITVQKDRISGETITERQRMQFEPEIGQFGKVS